MSRGSVGAVEQLEGVRSGHTLSSDCSNLPVVSIMLFLLLL